MTIPSPLQREPNPPVASTREDRETAPTTPHPPRLFASTGLSAVLLRCLAVLALVATLLARAIAPALPGSMTGIEFWIRLSDQGASYLSQLFVVASSLVTVRLLVTILRETRLSALFRLSAVPVGAAVLTLVIAATKEPINAQWALALGLVTALLAASAVPLALQSAKTRAVGLILGLVAAGALLQVCARLVAVRASGQALPAVFEVARSLASVALTVDVAVLVLATMWLAMGRWRSSALVAAPLLALCIFVSWSAVQGSQYQAPLWQVFASRVLAEMTRHPTPWVAPFFRYGVETATLLTVAVVLMSRRRDGALHTVVALALLVRGAADIPVLALALTLAALMTPLASIAAAPAAPGNGADTAARPTESLETAPPSSTGAR